MERIHISFAQHKETGLWLARCAEYPGFILHAHDEPGLESRLEPALEDYLEAKSGGPVRIISLENETPAGYSPASFIANAEMAKAA